MITVWNKNASKSLNVVYSTEGLRLCLCTQIQRPSASRGFLKGQNRNVGFDAAESREQTGLQLGTHPSHLPRSLASTRATRKRPPNHTPCPMRGNADRTSVNFLSWTNGFRTPNAGQLPGFNWAFDLYVFRVYFAAFRKLYLSIQTSHVNEQIGKEWPPDQYFIKRKQQGRDSSIFSAFSLSLLKVKRCV